MSFEIFKNKIVKNKKTYTQNNDAVERSVGLAFSRYSHKSFLNVVFNYTYINISKYISKKLSLYFSITYKYYFLVILRVKYDICNIFNTIKYRAKFEKKQKNKNNLLSEKYTKKIVKNSNLDLCYLDLKTVYTLY